MAVLGALLFYKRILFYSIFLILLALQQEMDDENITLTGYPSETADHTLIIVALVILFAWKGSQLSYLTFNFPYFASFSSGYR